jgi:hypothetical protein
MKRGPETAVGGRAPPFPLNWHLGLKTLQAAGAAREGRGSPRADFSTAAIRINPTPSLLVSPNDSFRSTPPNEAHAGFFGRGRAGALLVTVHLTI